MSPFFAAAALVLGLAVSVHSYHVNDVGVSWRHQFQYFLKDKSDAAKETVTNFWKAEVASFLEERPTQIVSYVFGTDLGLGPELYPNVTSPNADFAGRVDFISESALEDFWAALYPKQEYQNLLSTYVASAARIQYIPKTSLYTPGTYYRSTFEYNWDTTATSDQRQEVVYKWFKWAQAAPVKVKAFAAGADLGIGSRLYPTPNWSVGGSITFWTEEDLKAFWAYLYPRADYQALIKGVSKATRIQYAANY